MSQTSAHSINLNVEGVMTSLNLFTRDTRRLVCSQWKTRRFLEVCKPVLVFSQNINRSHQPSVNFEFSSQSAKFDIGPDYSQSVLTHER